MKLQILMRKLLIPLFLAPLLQGCTEIMSIFDSGPSDEELFKQAANVKKVFPPRLTNVTPGATTIDPDMEWKGACGADATVVLKSKALEKGEIKIPCNNKTFSQLMPWKKESMGQKISLSFLQSKGATNSEEQTLLLSLGHSKDPGRKVASEEPAKLAEPAKAAEPIKLAEPVKVAEPAKAAEPAKVAEPAKAAEPVKVAEPAKAAEPVKLAEPIKPAEPAKVAEPAKAAEPIKPAEPVPVMSTPMPYAAADKQTTEVSEAIVSKIKAEQFQDNQSGEVLIDLTGAIVINEVGAGGGRSFQGAKNLVDEQRVAGDPRLNKGNSGFSTAWSEAARLNKELEYQKPFLAGLFNLGKYYEPTQVYIFGGNNVVSFFAGGPVEDWIYLGQARLKPGQWNKIVFDKKINTQYLKMTIDYLSSDLDGQISASSGSEMVLYGKPLDTRAPAGKPQPHNILTPTTFDNFVGANIFIDDPVNSEWIYHPDYLGKLKQRLNGTIFGIEAFSHARVKLFTPWFLTNFDPTAPHWLLRFDTIALDNYTMNLDYYLTTLSKQKSLLNGKNISVLPSFDYTITSLFPDKLKQTLTTQNLWPKDTNGQLLYPWQYGRVKPISTGNKISAKLPSDYKDAAQLFYQYTARFGNTPSTALEQPRMLASDQKLVSGLGAISLIEAHQQPDRSRVSICPECSYFHPFEYAAYLSSLYDGNEKNLGPVYGVKNADPSTQVVFGSLSIPSIDYPLMVKMWSQEYRPNGKVPFDILSFSAVSRSMGKAATPEASGLYETFKKLVSDRDSYFPDKALWISDFGFESNPAAPMGVQVAAGESAERTQGVWTARGLLLLNAAGVDRVYLQQLVDSSQSESSSYGLIQSVKNQYAPKSSYFIVTSMLKALHGFRFEKMVDPIEDSKGNMDVVTLKFKHAEQPKRVVYITWTPTNNGNNHVMSQYVLPMEQAAKNIQLVELSSTAVEPTRSPASATDPIFKLDVKEIPTIIEIEEP